MTRHARTFISFLAAAVVFVGGCATTSPRPPLPPRPAPTGDPLVDYKTEIDYAPAKDKALWQYKLGAIALRRGEFGIAKTQFDDALALVAANYGNINKAAAKSRGMFTQEASKPFVGEAYERVMASFYRGIAYWADGEPDNARALFRTGELYDSDAIEKKYAGDYVLLDYLDGYVTARLSGNNPDAGADALQRARASAAAQDRAAPPDYDLSANVMVFLDYSAGPQKTAGGQNGEHLLYQIPDATATSARLTVGGRSYALPPYDDIGFQAVTRGGRVMDQILANKASFKEGADAIGNIGIVGAAVVLDANNNSYGRRNKDADIAALALLGVGLTSKIFSAATQTHADTRCWNNLPRYLSFAAVTLPPGTHNAELTFFDAHGNTLPQQTQRFAITVPNPSSLPLGSAPKDVVVYRSQLSK